MRRLQTLLTVRVGDEALDGRIGAVAAFVAALMLFLAGLEKVLARAGSEYELLVGTFLVLTLSTMLVVLGYMSAWVGAARKQGALRGLEVEAETD